MIIGMPLATNVIANNFAQLRFDQNRNKKSYAFIVMLKADSKIFIAYEDSDSFSAISKSAILPGTVAQIPNQEEMDALVFSEFWAEKSWANAVTAVTRANVIVVSLSGRTDLPVPVQRWMETWPNYEQVNHTTLVVVFGTEPTDDSTQNVLLSYFRQIAANHGLDFVCNCDSAKNISARPQFSEENGQVDMPRTEQYPGFNLALPRAA